MPEPLKIEQIIREVEEIFDRYNYREDIENELRNIGFDIWALIDDNPDEQIWAYDRGTPNGQVLILMNWIDCFAWIFKKEKVIHL